MTEHLAAWNRDEETMQEEQIGINIQQEAIKINFDSTCTRKVLSIGLGMQWLPKVTSYTNGQKLHMPKSSEGEAQAAFLAVRKAKEHGFCDSAGWRFAHHCNGNSKPGQFVRLEDIQLYQWCPQGTIHCEGFEDGLGLGRMDLKLPNTVARLVI